MQYQIYLILEENWHEEEDEEEEGSRVPWRPLRFWPSLLHVLSHKCASYLPVHLCLAMAENAGTRARMGEPITR